MKRSKIFSGCCNSLQWFLMGKNNNKNKRRLSAEGYSLLPSALRPRLLERKFTKNARFLAILALFQIVAASTIFGSLCSTHVSATSLTLTIPSSFSLGITPGAESVFSKSSEQKLNIKTDNNTGYTLSIKAKNSENSNVLLNGENKLNSISESTTEDLFKSDSKFNNTWGYMPSKFNNEDNTNFLPGPTNEESILETTENANNETGTDYNITLGAKVDNTTLSGSYDNNFVFSALANTPKYDAIMQNWTGCASLPDDGNTIVNLLDTRDDNIYTVAKLKDGKCWMTQNLRIQDKEISSEDSAMESGTFTIPPSDLTTFGTSKNTSYVYVDTENKDNGGYYSWYTAAAGQSNMAVNGSINSICPKGWHLPTKDEFSNLIANSNYDSDSIKAAPANFTTSGYVYNKKVSDLDTYGYYWSAGNYSGSTSSYSDAFKVYSSSSSPFVSYAYRYYGGSIRCVTGDMEVKEYSIKYDSNSGSGGPSENPQTGKTIGNDTDIKLSKESPIKNDYLFLGWCSANPGTLENCSGTKYNPGATYQLSNGANITLYATWLYFPTSVDKGDLGSMQSFNCSSKLPSVHNYGTVTDSRDNNTYKVAKLKGGKCWMIDNLMIVGRSISSSDSDMTSGTFNIPSSNLSAFNVGYGYNYVNNSAAYVFNEYYRGYYTWYTATAGTGNKSINTNGANATSSICPKGWRLPSSGKDNSNNPIGDFADLVTAYGGNNSTGSTNLRTTPVPGFIFAGHVEYDDGGLIGRGNEGNYWSSTAEDSTDAYNLRIFNSSLSPTAYYGRVMGYSIRCVAR